MDNITIRLRPLEEKDAARMLEWLRDEDVTRYLRIKRLNQTIDDALRFIENAKNESIDLHRAIADESDLYLGTVSLKNINHKKREAEYAIAMHPSAIGTGAAAAATRMIINHAVEELNLARVYLNVLRVNQRAVKFYEKLGFRYTHSGIAIFEGEDSELMWYDAVNNIATGERMGE